MKSNRILNLYDWFLILGVTVSSLIYSVYSVISGDAALGDTVLGAVAGIAGVFCVVLVAKGSIWNYLFGVVNVSLYAWISYNAALYGDAALNAFYYFPMQFIGWWQWRRRGEISPRALLGRGDREERVERGEADVVKARRLKWPARIILAIGCSVAVVACGFALRHFGDPQPFKDSATTVLSIVAQALMALAFMEQWVLWIITNVLSVVMWSILAIRGEAHAGLMVIMWIFYLLNSVNGLRVWLKLSRKY
ncbi:MAG: nicotinamide riboside transporter PnuC [Candidatus Cryptobacteroides sp.]